MMLDMVNIQSFDRITDYNICRAARGTALYSSDFCCIHCGTALAFHYTLSHDNGNLEVSATKPNSKLSKFYI
jgi:hypothetical protein